MTTAFAATYADLLTDCASWAKRSDLTDVIPKCVSLLEAWLNDELLLRDMETEATLTSSVGVNYVALPAGYVSPIALWLTINSIRQPLIPASPQELPYFPNSTQPRYWAIDGDNIRFDVPTDQAYSLPFRYIAKSNLSDSNQTNQLLLKRPDVYLAGTMTEIAKYTRDGEMLGAWEPRFLAAVKSLKSAENRARGMVRLRADLGLVSRDSAFNIYRG
jgi:hypothetical protein